MPAQNGTGFLILLALLYFVPAMIAIGRKHNNAAAIVVLNIVLGWAVIGWLIALIWSFTSNTKKVE